MIPTLAQICALASTMEQDIDGFAAGACRSMELWCGKLDAYLEKGTLSGLRELLSHHQMSAPVASYQGGLFACEDAARQEHWRLFARRLEQLSELGVNTLVVAADIAGDIDARRVEQIRDSLRTAAEQAGQAGMRLALEFQARAAFANNLQTTAALVADVGHPNLGICLDSFHFFSGPSKSEDLAYLLPANLFHVQMSDLAGVAREIAADCDRILPGDGDLPIAIVAEYLRQIGYTGPVSVELMNPRIWHIPPRQFGEIAVTALRKQLGQASMA